MTRASVSSLSLVRFDRMIEAFWLVGLVSIALAFRGREWVAFFSEPKYFLLHLTALAIIVLWFFEWALRPRSERTDIPFFDRVNIWLGRSPGRWAVAAAIIFGIATLAATLMSPLPRVSLWGRSNDALGYELYSVLSMLVICLTIALRLRTKNQALRLAGAVAAMGLAAALYGISQHFGWDPIGRGADQRRVLATFGNPLFFGSFLVMTLGVTLGLGLQLSADGKRHWLPVTSVVLGLQLSALWFTGSRGPWIGSTAALVVWGLLSWKWMGRRVFTEAAGTVAVGIVLAIVLTNLSGGAKGSRGFSDIFAAPGEVADAIGFAVATGGQTLSEFPSGEPGSTGATGTPTVEPGESVPDGTPGTGPDDGISDIEPEPTAAVEPEVPPPGEESDVPDSRSRALSGRAEIWRAALIVGISRDWPFAESGLVRGLRHLFGYGPDMFFYAYPLGSEPSTEFKGVAHAHNYPLHIILELGIVGFASLLATGALTLWAMIRLMRRNLGPDWRVILAGGVLAALVGRTIEQGTGVGRVSDLALFWALTGFALALTEIGDEPEQAARPTGRTSTRQRRSSSAASRPVPILAAIAVGLAAVTLFVMKDVSSLRAGWIAADAFELKASGDADESYKKFDSARKLAPEIERYPFEMSGFLTRTASAHTEVESRILFYGAARDQLIEYQKRDPYAWDTQLMLASVANALVEMGEVSLIPEQIARHVDMSALMPHFPLVQEKAAVILAGVGEWELALHAADQAIAMEAETVALPGAWWARGEALLNLGQHEDAQISFDISISRAPQEVFAGKSHRGLAALAELRGDGATAEEHSKLARAIELAILYR